MGAQISKAKSSSSILNESMMSIMKENETKCSASQTSGQIMTISNIESIGCSVNITGLSQEIDATNTIKCYQTTINETELKKKLAAKLKENIAAETSGIGGALFSSSDSESISNIVNDMTTNINIKELLECVNIQANKQIIDISSIKVTCNPGEDNSLNIQNISQKILATQISECVSTSETLTKAMDELDVQIDKTVSAKNLGIGLGGGASALSSSVLCCLCCLILVFILFGEE
jgi:hypothetical protein